MELEGEKEGKIMKFNLKALTDIQTGGVEQKDGKLHLSGIKGSIRWWYEALIRGLGGYACDPSSNGCKMDEQKVNKFNNKTEFQSQVKKIICPGCYLFGCTGWSGKFNLIIKNNEHIMNKQIEKDDYFTVEFIERKSFEPVEGILLKMCLKLIVDYGAIGGKIALKPSEKDNKNIATYGSGRHLDYGIVERAKDKKGDDISGIRSENIYCNDRKKEIDNYLKSFVAKSHSDNKSDRPDLKYFWFVKNYCISRKDHNRIVDRCLSGRGDYINPNELRIFIGGFIEEERKRRNDLKFPSYASASKKIFSFHGIKPDAVIKDNETLSATDNRIIPSIRRCFGYAEKDKLDDVINLIENNCTDLKGKIEKGTEVLNYLL